MNGALFLLTVNFLIAQLFCVFFLVISRRSRIPAAGRWFAAAFAVASLSAIFEVVIRYADVDRLASFGAFSSVLGALLMIRVGLGRLYGVPANVLAMTVLFGASLTLNLMIYDLPRGTFSHSLGYQMPFAIAELICAIAVYRSGRRETADRILMALLLLTAGEFCQQGLFCGDIQRREHRAGLSRQYLCSGLPEPQCRARRLDGADIAGRHRRRNHG